MTAQATTATVSVQGSALLPAGVLADAAPPGHLRREHIDIAPLQRFLSGAAWPVYGDDPRSVDREKVFSVAPIRLNGELQGYLYIILQGEELNALAETAWQQTFWNTVMWTLLLVAIFGALAWVLRRRRHHPHHHGYSLLALFLALASVDASPAFHQIDRKSVV